MNFTSEVKHMESFRTIETTTLATMPFGLVDQVELWLRRFFSLFEILYTENLSQFSSFSGSSTKTAEHTNKHTSKHICICRCDDVISALQRPIWKSGWKRSRRQKMIWNKSIDNVDGNAVDQRSAFPRFMLHKWNKSLKSNQISLTDITPDDTPDDSCGPAEAVCSDYTRI